MYFYLFILISQYITEKRYITISVFSHYCAALIRISTEIIELFLSESSVITIQRCLTILSRCLAPHPSCLSLAPFSFLFHSFVFSPSLPRDQSDAYGVDSVRPDCFNFNACDLEMCPCVCSSISCEGECWCAFSYWSSYQIAPWSFWCVYYHLLQNPSSHVEPTALSQHQAWTLHELLLEQL